MKNNTKNKYLIISASVLMLCQSIAQADWRDYVPSMQMPSRQDMTNMIWSKYGAIGGTFVALAIVGGLWLRSGRSFWGSKGTSLPQYVPLSEHEIQEIARSGNSEGVITALDPIYAQQQWANIPNFHTFIIKLWTQDQTVNKKTLATSLAGTYSDPLLCYILAKESMIITSLIKQYPNLTQVSLLLKNLVTQAQCKNRQFSTMDDPKAIAQYEAEIIKTGNISKLVHLLDVLYGIQRWEGTKNFHTWMLHKINKLSAQQTKPYTTQTELIALLSSKNTVARQALTQEAQLMSRGGMNFINEHDRQVILNILSRLIEVTAANPQEGDMIEKEKEKATISQDIGEIIAILDTIYQLQNLNDFHQAFITNHVPTVADKEALIKALQAKNEKVYQALLAERGFMSQTTPTFTSNFVHPNAQKAIIDILNHLIELVKP